MQRGTTLTEHKFRKILALKDLMKNTSEIAKIVYRSRTAVQNILLYGRNYNTKKRTGRKSELSVQNNR